MLCRGIVPAGMRLGANSGSHLKIRNITQEGFSHLRILKSNFKIGLEIAKGVTGIVVFTLEKQAEKTLVLAK